MLHQQDQNLLMLHPEKNKSILRMDLNRSDVVEEWVTTYSKSKNKIYFRK